MCGIFGMFGEQGNEPLAREVLASLAHRGPDDRGVKYFPEGWMAHTRLAIIDLSPLGRQPMPNHRGTTWIVYNGEIYNYLELREELDGYPFRTRTDTEVILAAYDRWGAGCVRRLRGMFAFGLWDAQRQRLFCATDRFSIKPLYYYADGRRLIFSSEAKPIARCGVSLRPNARLLHDYLALGLLDHEEETLFEGITQLRPGTCLTYQDGRLAVRRYWDLDDDESELGADGDTAEVEQRLLDAVKLHLRGDVEVGLSLSSGLDSQVLKALMLKTAPGSKPLRCFTYSFPGTPYDEHARNGAFAEDERCRTHAVELEPQAMLEGLGDLIRVMEGPVGGLGIYGYWRNAKLAADHGIKVLLDGQGADETFAGYRYYYDQQLRQLWERGDRNRALEEFRQVGRAEGRQEQPFESWLAAQPSSALVMAPDSTELTSSYVDPEFAASVPARTHEFPAPFSCAVKNIMYRDLFYLKIPKLLRFQDRCAMAWGVEVRVPYLDHLLVERLYAVPTAQLLRCGSTKALLRAIAARYLPKERLRAPKLYVAAPQREWVKTALRRPIERMIQESVLAEQGYIVKTLLWRQFQDYTESPALGNSFFIWKFINLELWYRTFCASPPAPIGAHAAVERAART